MAGPAPTPQNGRPPQAPIPDPTRLTTEAVDRLKDALTELFGTRFDALHERMDRLQSQLDARPAAVVAEIGHLKELSAEKFKGVADQFLGRDTALAAALFAQKTAVDEQNKSNALSIAKSDAATAKQIDAIASNIGTITGAINEKVDDARSRLQAIESRGAGRNDSWVWIVGGLGALLTVIGLITFIAPILSRASP